MRANAFLAGAHEVRRQKPLVHWNVRPLINRADCRGELLPTVAALVQPGAMRVALKLPLLPTTHDRAMCARSRLEKWIAAGAHLNAVGSSIASARELDGATVAASSLFVDRRESTVNESGDYLMALKEGAIRGPEHIRAELGEILTGQSPGRTSREEITLFKSLGVAIEDLAAAQFLFEKARSTGAGVWVDF